MPMGGNGKDQIERRKASEMKAGWHVVVCVCVCVCVFANVSTTMRPAFLLVSEEAEMMTRCWEGKVQMVEMVKIVVDVRIVERRAAAEWKPRVGCEPSFLASDGSDINARTLKEGEGGRRRRRRVLMLSGQMNELVMNDMEKEQSNRRPAGRD